MDCVRKQKSTIFKRSFAKLKIISVIKLMLISPSPYPVMVSIQSVRLQLYLLFGYSSNKQVYGVLARIWSILRVLAMRYNLKLRIILISSCMILKLAILQITLLLLDKINGSILWYNLRVQMTLYYTWTVMKLLMQIGAFCFLQKI